MSYINIIITACIVFPVLAFFITLPFVIYNYNKYGSVLFIRALLIYGFVLYLMSAYFLIIMPLPSISEVAKMTTKVQLVPFDVFSKIYHTVYFDYKDISTYVNIFKNAYVYQSIYNFLLTVPFGIFLRYYFRCNFKKTIFFTFLLSLFFELTQLTGLYFIYPNAYRLFDVDDLFINTLGGLFGYAITPLFTLLLPSAKELDIKSYKKGAKVSSTKRIITLLIDSFFTIIFIFIEIVMNYIYKINSSYYIYFIVGICIFFIIIPLINNGPTLGYKITNMTIISTKSDNLKRYQVLIRNLILCIFYIPLGYYIYLVFKLINKIANHNYGSIVIIGYIFAVSIIALFMLIRNFILRKVFLYEKISKTKVVSTIEVPN